MFIATKENPGLIDNAMNQDVCEKCMDSHYYEESPEFYRTIYKCVNCDNVLRDWKF